MAGAASAVWWGVCRCGFSTVFFFFVCGFPVGVFFGHWAGNSKKNGSGFQ